MRPAPGATSKVTGARFTRMSNSDNGRRSSLLHHGSIPMRSLADQLTVASGGHPVSRPSISDELEAAGRTVKRTARTREGRKGVLIYVEKEMAEALSDLAKQKGTTIQALGLIALRRLLKGE